VSAEISLQGLSLRLKQLSSQGGVARPSSDASTTPNWKASRLGTDTSRGSRASLACSERSAVRARTRDRRRANEHG
jgi:hypothetical protein